MFVLTTDEGDIWVFKTLDEARRNQYIFGGEIERKKMKEIKIGYLVEYSERTSSIPSGSFGERKEIICSKKYLNKFLMKPLVAVWSAKRIDVTEYQLNHKEKQLEEIGFDE